MSLPTKASVEGTIAGDIASFRWDPLGYAKYAYPWKTDLTGNSPGPRNWQQDLDNAISEHLKNPVTRFTPFLGAIASGHGVGKSAEVAMLTEWGLSTCADCRIILTANSDPQLTTKTWPEINKWFRLSINGHWFSMNALSITIKDPKHERTWRADRLTWSINNPQAFAGLHNQGKRIIIIFDEASEIDDVIWEVTEGALTDAETEIIWLVFGNPTQNTGRFRECFGRFKHRWYHLQIDSRKVEGTNKEQAQKYVEDYGEDSDFVRVRVRGEFPRSGANQFISSEVVEAARRYHATGYEAMPKVLAVDVARFGDDQTVIGWRQGRRFHITDKLRGQDTMRVANRVVERYKELNPDAMVGDGDGIGGGVIDVLRSWGYDIEEFHGSPPANDTNMYFNRRAEVWGETRAWLTAGAEIDDDSELAMDLVGPQYGMSGKQQIQMEQKKDMKKRGLASPDLADCLAMTFSIPLSPKIKVNKNIVQYQYAGQASGSWMA